MLIVYVSSCLQQASMDLMSKLARNHGTALWVTKQKEEMQAEVILGCTIDIKIINLLKYCCDKCHCNKYSRSDQLALRLRHDSEVEVHHVWEISAACESHAVLGIEALPSMPVLIRVRSSRHFALQELLGCNRADERWIPTRRGCNNCRSELSWCD